MKKRMFIMILLIVLVTAAFIGYKFYAMQQGMKAMAAGFAPPSVSTIKATTQDWQPQLHAIGSLRAINGADLSSEVAGIVEDIKYDSNGDVEAGAVLVQLRAEDDIAKLQSYQAMEKLAEINTERDQKQLKIQAVSQAAVDTDMANLNAAKAQVAEQQAIVDKKTIRAPFAGHLGIRKVDIGQYLNPGDAIITLQQLDPIYIDFDMPEQSLPRLSQNQKVTVTIDGHSDKSFVGTITAINSRVDVATRNISVRATLQNPEKILLPGMFANVTVDVGTPEKFVTLPQTAVVYNTYGNTVYLVQPSAGEGKPQTVKQSVVITGETRGDQVTVLSGVKDGDEVVTSGQVKLRNESPIVINNDVQPSNDPNPKPHEQ